MKPWLWSPALLAAFEAADLSWVILDGPLTRADLGSSPDFCVYVDRTAWMQADTPERWVAHELGHFLTAQALAPELLDLRNYGWETVEGDLMSPAESIESNWEHELGWECGMEETASSVALALLVDLGLDWKDYVAHIRPSRRDMAFGCLLADDLADLAARVLPPERLRALRDLQVLILGGPDA